MGLGVFPEVVSDTYDSSSSSSSSTSEEAMLSVFMVGNSFLYFNDAPRLLKRLLIKASKASGVVVESCLSPGKSLSEVWRQGNGMRQVFGTQNARCADGSLDVGAASAAEALRRGWDFVVLQDHSLGPATAQSREETRRLLVEEVAPTLQRATPVILETWAYATGYDGTCLQTFDEKLAEGVEVYRHALQHLSPRVARVGAAFAFVRKTKPAVWRRLFFDDEVHPSPLGTYLLAALLVAALIDRPPPPPPLTLTAVKHLWSDARFMLPDSYIPWPTPGDLSYIHGVVLAFAS